jgi:pimeloyl-ACP methyl ester carboxylesterase
VTRVVSAAGKRRLAVETWGAPDGMPVFLLHGTPGSRNGPRPRGIVLYRLGVHLICYDRPGYGRSDRLPERAVADAADDVATIADAFGIDRFGIVGRSGGGPHALACASLLEERVERAAALVSLAPSDAEGLDWYDGMAGSNVDEYSSVDADADLATITASLVERAGWIRDDPENLLRFLLPELAGPDRRVVDDIAIRRILTETYAEALRYSADGWIDDVLALRRSWGFDLSAIKAPVLLWHGAADMFSPVGHTHWLANQIPNSTLQVESGAAHFGAVEILPRVLAWIAAPAGADSRFEPAGAPSGR